MARGFQDIKVSINRFEYVDATGRHVGDPVWRESIIVIVKHTDGNEELDNIALDSFVDVQDIGINDSFSGEYQYIGGNNKQYIFRKNSQ